MRGGIKERGKWQFGVYFRRFSIRWNDFYDAVRYRARMMRWEDDIETGNGLVIEKDERSK